jgi:hypothetical protein
MKECPHPAGNENDGKQGRVFVVEKLYREPPGSPGTNCPGQPIHEQKSRNGTQNWREQGREKCSVWAQGITVTMGICPTTEKGDLLQMLQVFIEKWVLALEKTLTEEWHILENDISWKRLSHPTGALVPAVPGEER